MNVGDCLMGRQRVISMLIAILWLGMWAPNCTRAVDDEDERSPGPDDELVDVRLDGGGANDGNSDISDGKSSTDQVLGVSYDRDGSCREAGLAREISGAAGWLACDIDLTDMPEGEYTFSDDRDFATNSQICADKLEVLLKTYQTEEGQQLDWESLAAEPIRGVLVHSREDSGVANFYHYSDGAVLAKGLQSVASGTPVVGGSSSEISHISFCLPYRGELGVGKHIFPDYTAVVEWQIESIPEVEQVELADGATAIVNHDSLASLVGDVEFINYRVEGDVYVVNLRNVYAELQGVITVAGTVHGEVDCGVEFPYALAPDESLHCTSSIRNLDGHHGRVAAIAEVTDDSPLRGASYENAIRWPAPKDASHSDGVVHVKGHLQNIFDFTGECRWWHSPCLFQHKMKFDCPGSEGLHDNVVEIPQTGQIATSEVDVVCNR